MNTANLAATMIRLFLAHLVLCQDDFGAEEVMFWASLLRFEEGAADLCREIMAYRKAMQRLRESRAGNPRNVVAVLLYNVSRSGERDPKVQERWERRLRDGFTLDKVARLDQAMEALEELKGAYLSERQVGVLVGRVVNLDRVTQLIIDEHKKTERGDCDGR